MTMTTKMMAEAESRFTELGLTGNDQDMIECWLENPLAILVVFTNSPRTTYCISEDADRFQAADTFGILLKTHFP